MGAEVQAFTDAAILVARADAKRVVAGGDDGKVIEVTPDGQAATQDGFKQ